MSEIDQSAQPSPVTSSELSKVVDYLPQIQHGLIILGGASKIFGAVTSYSHDINGSLTRVQPFKSMLYLAVLSGVSGVFNVMWIMFQLLGGVPSFILNVGSTLVYLLEPSAALLIVAMGMMSGMSFDYTLYLQMIGYVAELGAGILMVINL